ncbi:hypothetical protein BGZ98_002560, partial [Dissophora globulifera]
MPARPPPRRPRKVRHPPQRTASPTTAPAAAATTSSPSVALNTSTSTSALNAPSTRKPWKRNRNKRRTNNNNNNNHTSRESAAAVAAAFAYLPSTTSRGVPAPSAPLVLASSFLCPSTSSAYIPASSSVPIVTTTPEAASRTRPVHYRTHKHRLSLLLTEESESDDGRSIISQSSSGPYSSSASTAPIRRGRVFRVFKKPTPQEQRHEILQQRRLPVRSFSPGPYNIISPLNSPTTPPLQHTPFSSRSSSPTPSLSAPRRQHPRPQRRRHYQHSPTRRSFDSNGSFIVDLDDRLTMTPDAATAADSVTTPPTSTEGDMTSPALSPDVFRATSPSSTTAVTAEEEIAATHSINSSRLMAPPSISRSKRRRNNRKKKQWADKKQISGDDGDEEGDNTVLAPALELPLSRGNEHHDGFDLKLNFDRGQSTISPTAPVAGVPSSLQVFAANTRTRNDSSYSSYSSSACVSPPPKTAFANGMQSNIDSRLHSHTSSKTTGTFSGPAEAATVNSAVETAITKLPPRAPSPPCSQSDTDPTAQDDPCAQTQAPSKTDPRPAAFAMGLHNGRLRMRGSSMSMARTERRRNAMSLMMMSSEYSEATDAAATAAAPGTDGGAGGSSAASMAVIKASPEKSRPTLATLMSLMALPECAPAHISIELASGAAGAFSMPRVRHVTMPITPPPSATLGSLESQLAGRPAIVVPAASKPFSGSSSPQRPDRNHKVLTPEVSPELHPTAKQQQEQQRDRYEETGEEKDEWSAETS